MGAVVRRDGRLTMRVFVFTLVVLISLSAAVGQAQERIVEVNRIRLYLPDEALRQRLGNDPSALANYIRTIKKETTEFWEKAEQPKAKGLLIVVGVKPDHKSKVWCDPVDGTITPENISKLEKRLGDLPTVEVSGPIAFGVEIKLWGQEPSEFPETPKAWVDAAKTSMEPVMVPDGLFKIMWPDEPPNQEQSGNDAHRRVEPEP